VSPSSPVASRGDIIIAGLIGAIAWNLFTWWLGLPSSSSHALIGGLVGAALVQSGTKGVLWHGLVHKVAIPALVAPLIAFTAAFGLLLVIYWVFQWLTRRRRESRLPPRPSSEPAPGSRSLTVRTTRRRRWG